jgi:glucosylceramidase
VIRRAAAAFLLVVCSGCGSASRLEVEPADAAVVAPGPMIICDFPDAGDAAAVLLRTTEWMASTDATRWQQRTPPSADPCDGEPVDLEVLDGARAQSIDGFGGCFNELGWNALAVLDAAGRDDVLRNLFDPTDGCGFTLARMPIGASDYATSWYSLDDTPGDYPMTRFNIDRDKTNLIAYVRAAMKWSPGLRVWGSAWSPPAWMKSSGVYNGGHIEQDARTLEAYALYLAKYVAAYRAEGVDVYAVHVQNEPFSSQIFPSCVWDGYQMRDFVRDRLGPRFARDALGAEIWLGTINNGDYQNAAGIVLSDAAASAFITGVGYQWDGKGAILATHQKHPDKKLMQTETECGDGSNDWAYAEYTWSLFKLYLRAFANAYMQWNMVLDETGKSTWDWRQSAMISVDRATHAVSYNPQFFLVKHISHYVRPAAYRLETKGVFDDALAFVNADGARVVVLFNPERAVRAIRIKVGSALVRLTLDPRSFNTLILKP